MTQAPRTTPVNLLDAIRELVLKVLTENGLGEQVRHTRLARVEACDAENARVDLAVLLPDSSASDDTHWPILEAVELPCYAATLGVGSIVRVSFISGNRSGLYIQGIELAVDPCWKIRHEGGAFVEVSQAGVVLGGSAISLGENASAGVPLGEQFVDALALELAACKCAAPGSPLVVSPTLAATLKSKCSQIVKVAP